MREMKSVDRMKMDIRTIVYLVMLFVILSIAGYSLKIGSIRIYEFLFFLAGSMLFIIWNLKDRMKTIKSNIDSVLETAEKAVKAGKWQVAVNAYDELIAAKPNHFQTLIKRAECYKHLAGYKEAIHEVRKIAETFPKEPEAHFLLGVCYFEGRYTDEAQDCFETVLRLNPGYHDVFPYLGDINKMNRNMDKAQEYYEKYIQAGKNEKMLQSVKDKMNSIGKH